VLRLDSINLRNDTVVEDESCQIQEKSVVEKEADGDQVTDGVINGVVKEEDHEQAEQDVKVSETFVAAV